MHSETQPETPTNLCTYLESNAQRCPDRLAVRDSEGTGLTYGELNQRANRIAAFLVDRGVKAGDRVGLVMPKNTNAFTILFGIDRKSVV